MSGLSKARNQLRSHIQMRRDGIERRLAKLTDKTTVYAIECRRTVEIYDDMISFLDRSEIVAPSLTPRLERHLEHVHE